MQRDLVIDEQLSIPHGELRFSFARSSGPGGQNVNKVNTKAVLRWRPAESLGLPDAVRARLLSRLANRLTTDGELVIASDRHREQGRNVGECLSRLRALVAAAKTPPKRRVATRPSRAANERRLREKRARSQRKSSRQKPPEED